ASSRQAEIGRRIRSHAIDEHCRATELNQVQEKAVRKRQRLNAVRCHYVADVGRSRFEVRLLTGYFQVLAHLAKLEPPVETERLSSSQDNPLPDIPSETRVLDGERV